VAEEVVEHHEMEDTGMEREHMQIARRSREGLEVLFTEILRRRSAVEVEERNIEATSHSQRTSTYCAML